MHAFYDEDKNSLRIVVANYHDGEYPYSRMGEAKGQHVRYVWDSLTQDLLEKIYGGKYPGQLSDEGEAMFDAFMEDQLRWDHVNVAQSVAGADLVGQTIYVVSGTPEAILDGLMTYAHALEEDVASGGPGADDGTYDYFPGAVEACLQLVGGFKEVGLYVDKALLTYNKLVATARETHYADDVEAEDLLPYATLGEVS